MLFEIRDWFLEIVNTPELALNTALEICFLIALDLDELEQKGVLEEEFSRYQRETDIGKFKRPLGQIWI